VLRAIAIPYGIRNLIFGIFRAYSRRPFPHSPRERGLISMVQAQANTIIVVDDFAEFRRFVRSKLQGNGFHVVAEAADGLEAVAKTAELQPDLVLLDIAMPNVNRLEAAAQIRTVAPKSRILFVSQNTDPDIVQSVMSDGAAGYLCKFKINHDLVPAIEAALAGKKFVGVKQEAHSYCDG